MHIFFSVGKKKKKKRKEKKNKNNFSLRKQKKKRKNEKNNISRNSTILSTRINFSTKNTSLNYTYSRKPSFGFYS